MSSKRDIAEKKVVVALCIYFPIESVRVKVFTKASDEVEERYALNLTSVRVLFLLRYLILKEEMPRKSLPSLWTDLAFLMETISVLLN